ncbi:MAG TPA: hypothetical protein VF707_11565 [Ardenticatenaceae bacterium]|jgi:disulfide oxidoreductase YuzD
MDPIVLVTTIVAALTLGVAQGARQVGEAAVVDSYNALKAVLRRKFGDQSDVVEAVDKLEARPDSEGRWTMLKEEIEATSAHQDPDVQQAAQALQQQIAAQPGGQQQLQQIQQAIGSNIAQNLGSGSASVNVNQPRQE